MAAKGTDYVGQLYEDFRHNPANSQQALTERFYLRWITELAVNRFKWSGFPEMPEGDIRPRYMELVMFRKAMVVFFKHPQWGQYLCMQASLPGHQDMYYDPTAFHLYGNGATPGIDGLTVSAKEAVPIWTNYLRAPDLDMVSIYVRRIAQFDRTLEINLKTLRHPYVLFADDQNRQSVMQMYRQIDEGQPAVIFNKAMGGPDGLKDLVQVLNMNTEPKMLTELLVAKKKVWQEMLTFLGINNSNQEKRERLVASEVTANDDEVVAARTVALRSREEACEKINTMFGLNVAVEWNTQLDTEMPGMEDMEDMEDTNEAGKEGDE